MTQLPSNGSEELEDGIELLALLRLKIRNTLYNTEIGFSMANAGNKTPETMAEELTDKLTEISGQFITKALAQKDREILEARLDELRNSIWENYDSIYDAGDVDKAMGKIKERITELTEQINKAKEMK